MASQEKGGGDNAEIAEGVAVSQPVGPQYGAPAMGGHIEMQQMQPQMMPQADMMPSASGQGMVPMVRTTNPSIKCEIDNC